MIKFNSATHDLLQISKVFNRPFTAKEAMKVMVSLDRPSRVHQCADVLIKDGLMGREDDGSYVITDNGRKYLYLMVSINNRGFRGANIGDNY